MTDQRSSLLAAVRPSAAHLPESGILKVFNYGRSRDGLIPLWAGEGDLPTPGFICEAAQRSMLKGETFYTANRGIPELRQALARYQSRLYGMPFSPDEFYVTGGGMQAIQLALQALVGDGDEVLVPEPAWPNFEGAINIQGAKVVPVAMRFTAEGWTLPLDTLFAAAGPRARVIVINSPANPTGWTAGREELKAILEFARRRGLWIIADEIYARFHFAGGLAPSFLEWRQPEDRIIFVNTFSKMWAMTGWRIGWLQAPPVLGPLIENLVQYNTSGVAPFMQRAAIAALEDGEEFARQQIARAAAGRAIVAGALQGSNQVRYTTPAGAFYAFFAIEGLADSMSAALKLVDDANVGLAPGIAFGAQGEGYFRICFLRSEEPLTEAMQRLVKWLRSRPGAAAR
jgi:aspartate/methionine/tyrosine aminotransferase